VFPLSYAIPVSVINHETKENQSIPPWASGIVDNNTSNNIIKVIIYRLMDYVIPESLNI